MDPNETLASGPHGVCSPQGGNPDVPPDQRPTLRKLLDQGVTAYKEILELLAPYICPDEAATAEKATRKAIAVLYAAIAGLGLLACLPSTVRIKDDLLAAVGLISVLVLVSRYRVSFAGRLLLVPVALLAFHIPSYATWNPLDDAWESLDVLLWSLLLACLIDYGASTEPERSRPRHRCIALVLAGAGIFAAAALKYEMPITAGAAVLAVTWTWWPAPRLARRLACEDADTLWLLAMRRWSFVTWARVLAVSAVLIPFFLFLHSLGLKDRLQWPSEDSEIITTRVGEGPHAKTHAWFWQPRGSYLREKDLRREPFYGLKESESGKIEELREELAAANRGKGGREPEAIFHQIEGLLAPFRISDSKSFDKLVREGSEFNLYHLEQPPPGSRKSMARRLRGHKFLAEDLMAPMGTPLLQLRDDRVRELMRHNALWHWLLLGYGLVGFVLLWRRGGDSRLGRWLGLWFIAAGTLGMIRFANFFLPALSYAVSHQSDLPTETLINLLLLAAVVLLALFLGFVICAAVWTHACWPTAHPHGPARWTRTLLTAAKIALVTVCMSALFYLPWLALRENTVVAALSGIAVFPSVSFGVGFLLRRRTAGHPNRIAISNSAGYVLLVIQAVVVTTFFAERLRDEASLDITPSLVESLKLASVLSGSLFLVFIAILIFTKDFLHLSAVRDFSLAVTAMVVPAMLAWSEELSASYVSVFAENLIATRGKEILAVVLAVGLLPPLCRRIERLALYATQPDLLKKEHSIRETLECLFDFRQPGSLQQIDELLRGVGLEGSILYVRQTTDSFVAAQSTPAGCAVEIKASSPLRRFLAANPGFHNLKRLALEWRYFFVQFELHRMRKATCGHFVLPISLGGSVRALLLIPARADSSRLSEEIARDIAQLRLFAAQLRILESEVA